MKKRREKEERRRRGKERRRKGWEGGKMSGGEEGVEGKGGEGREEGVEGEFIYLIFRRCGRMGRERGLTWSSRFVRQFNSVLALPAWMQYTATMCVCVCVCVCARIGN